MNKEEYREEVLRQLKEQNTHLINIEAIGVLIAILVLFIFLAVLWQNCSIGNIEEYVSNINIKHGDLLRQISDSMDYLEDKLELIYTTIRYK